VAVARSDELTVVGREEINGHPCVVLDGREHFPSGYSSPQRWWLAEDMDYAVLRTAHMGGAVPGYSWAEFTYEPDPEVGWRLASWEVGVDPYGSHILNVVEEIEFNADVPDSLFACFPPGTRVRDGDLDVVYVVGEPSEAERNAVKTRAPR
jgi:hypothetical protein